MQKTKIAPRTKAALWLMIAPTVLLILGFLLNAVVNLLVSPSEPSPDGTLFADTPVILTIFNVLTFVVGAISFITWLPGMIIGIILLATKPAAR